MVQVIESTVWLTRFVALSVENGPANEFIFNCASSQASTLRFYLRIDLDSVNHNPVIINSDFTVSWENEKKNKRVFCSKSCESP